MVDEWLELLDKEHAATFDKVERLTVCMFHLTSAIYWLDESPNYSMKYQLRAAAHLIVQYEQIVEMDSIYYDIGGVTAATRHVTYAIDTIDDEYEQVTHLHKALECLYGAWYDSKRGKEATNG